MDAESQVAKRRNEQIGEGSRRAFDRRSVGQRYVQGHHGLYVEGLKSIEGGRALSERSGNARKRKADDSEEADAKKARGMS